MNQDVDSPFDERYGDKILNRIKIELKDFQDKTVDSFERSNGFGNSFSRNCDEIIDCIQIKSKDESKILDNPLQRSKEYGDPFIRDGIVNNGETMIDIENKFPKPVIKGDTPCNHEQIKIEVEVELDLFPPSESLFDQ